MGHKVCGVGTYVSKCWPKVTVVEVNSRLVRQSKLVGVRSARLDWPLRHSRNAIIPVFIHLVDPMPGAWLSIDTVEHAK